MLDVVICTLSWRFYGTTFLEMFVLGLDCFKDPQSCVNAAHVLWGRKAEAGGGEAAGGAADRGGCGVVVWCVGVVCCIDTSKFV